ncbi:uncharacterized protein LOC124722333 [Schistocerca piceifrons]|uniref:uncharacterized protein LOC124722333 n=1 Tax=Schistocerca piceifrons TaxID=274613 RepID=UPI001F5FCA7F|nr:uncharacterized protein LOC124722333 [Schistocerca piceifrons]
MEKYLRNINISYLEDLQVNITPAAEVVFHFFGGKSDGRKVREAMNRLVERGRLADVPLVRTALAFRQEPTLLLQRNVKHLHIGQVRKSRVGCEITLTDPSLGRHRDRKSLSLNCTYDQPLIKRLDNGYYTSQAPYYLEF